MVAFDVDKGFPVVLDGPSDALLASASAGASSVLVASVSTASTGFVVSVTAAAAAAAATSSGTFFSVVSVVPAAASSVVAFVSGSGSAASFGLGSSSVDGAAVSAFFPV